MHTGIEKGKRMKEPGKYMRISQLSKRSGISAQEIRYYVHKEILPKPVKINRTSALYNGQHLERLELIKKLHKEKQLPIAVIQRVINSVIAAEGGGIRTQPMNPSVLREELVNSSIEVFRKKGYEGTTITDIVEAANISRNTFYRNFKSKEELFIECLNEIFFGWRREVPKEHGPLSEAMVRKRLDKIFVAVYKAYPKWSDMMNLLRSAALKDPETFADKLQNSLDTRIEPIVNDINEWISQGIIKQVNSELLAIMLAGIAEYVCYYLHRNKFSQQPAEIGDQTIDILFNGVLLPKDQKRKSKVFSGV
jgi:AcrR family transcriptional regulator